MGSMLRTLRHGFLKEALDFAGVHRERLAEVCKHSFALMMAILGHASRHEIFTNEITASIDHIKNGRASGKLTLTETVPEAFEFPCFWLVTKYFVANQDHGGSWVQIPPGTRIFFPSPPQIKEFFSLNFECHDTLKVFPWSKSFSKSSLTGWR